MKKIRLSSVARARTFALGAVAALTAARSFRGASNAVTPGDAVTPLTLPGHAKQLAVTKGNFRVTP